MFICNQRTIIFLVIIKILFVLILILHKISLNNQERKLIITIVDYRWNPVVNISVRCETIETSYQEYYTNNQGQVIFHLENNEEYIQISAGERHEKVLSTIEELTLRLNRINQNTGEMYDDELFN